MKLLAVTIIVLTLAALISQRPVTAGQKDSIQPACVQTVPSSWGEFKGASHDYGFAFEDKDGTLRFVRDLQCEMSDFQKLPPPYLEVRRK